MEIKWLIIQGDTIVQNSREDTDKCIYSKKQRVMTACNELTFFLDLFF